MPQRQQATWQTGFVAPKPDPVRAFGLRRPKTNGQMIDPTSSSIHCLRPLLAQRASGPV